MKKFCYHEPHHILDHEDIKYFICGRAGIRHFAGDLILNLTDTPGPSKSNIYAIKSLSKHMQILPEEIMLICNDFGTPPVKSSFWTAFHQYCKSKNYTSVCIHCEQGHGRTGTAICSLLIALKNINFIDSISYIREAYCPNAVESEEQLKYLVDLAYELNNHPKLTDDEIMQFIPTISNANFDILSYFKDS